MSGQAAKRIDVVGAAIIRGGRVLAARRGAGRSQAGKWEVPGGKVESGEQPHDALRREIREELDCDVEVGRRIETTEHDGGTAVICLSVYACALAAGEPTPIEHSRLRWLTASELDDLDWAPADLPTVRRLAGSPMLS